MSDTWADIDAVESRPRPGAVLDGRYRLERPLGSGGMGTVWAARQLVLDRPVAVKLLKDLDTPSSERLRREALALASIRHPAVVQVLDFGRTAAGVPYLVMELLSGVSIDEHLGRVGSVDAREAVSVMVPVLEGLAAAHAAGVVHRDLKPANVLLAERAGALAPTLIDFGIARVDEGVSAGPALTIAGNVVGTPAYMAPEQVRGLRADARSDVWAAGALLYELVAGAPPFDAADVFALMRQVLESPPPYPRRARGLDGALWAIVTRALRKNAAERPATALELRDLLGAWLAEQGGPTAVRAADAAQPVPAPSPWAAPSAPDAATGVAPTTPAPDHDDDDAPRLDGLIRARLGDG